MDIKTTFLHRVIKEEVYIEKPKGFEVHGRDTHVCRLNVSLYGLKKAPRAWYEHIRNYLQGMGLKSEANSNLYYIMIGGEPLILVLYVDDLFLTGSPC